MLCSDKICYHQGTKTPRKTEEAAIDSEEHGRLIEMSKLVSPGGSEGGQNPKHE